MLEEELGHKATFDKLMAENRVRPTVLLPFWNVAGFLLGKTDIPKNVKKVKDPIALRV